MSVSVDLPEDLVQQIDDLTDDRTGFVTEAVRHKLRHSDLAAVSEVERINEVADELNREAEDVLEYQVLS